MRLFLFLRPAVLSYDLCGETHASDFLLAVLRLCLTQKSLLRIIGFAAKLETAKRYNVSKSCLLSDAAFCPLLYPGHTYFNGFQRKALFSPEKRSIVR